jgi:hypothetical protein
MKIQEGGTDRMKEIASYVSEGAMAYLRRQYSVVISDLSLGFYTDHTCISWCSEPILFPWLFLREVSFQDFAVSLG